MKGYVYTLEALIGISLIITSMVFLFGDSATKPELEISIIKQQGFEALEYLDKSGFLRGNLDDEAAIENKLSTMMPVSVNLEAEICKTNCSELNLPVNMTTIAIDYYISGYKSDFIGKRVRLWLWREY